VSWITVLAVALLLVIVAGAIVLWYAYSSLANALDEDGKRPPLRYLDDEEE